MNFSRVEALSSGNCIKIDNTLKSSVDKIEFELEKNKKYEDHFTIYNERRVSIDGEVYNDNPRLTINNKIINGKVVELVFNINTIDLVYGDVIEGNITIYSNVGMLNVPYKYTIKEDAFLLKLREVDNITKFYELLSSDFIKTRDAFLTSNILEMPLMKEEFAINLYMTLIQGSNKNVALIEFFRAYEIDIVSLFNSYDENVVRYYTDETFDTLDLNKIRDVEGLSSLLVNNTNQLNNEDNKKDDFIIEIINELYDKELLNAMASMCVRINNTDYVAFSIYLKVVERGSNIPGIYDKFLASIPHDYNSKLPQYIYRYYYEDDSYQFDEKVRLYENIISCYDENDDVYELYKKEIIEFAISRIYQNHITEPLVKIYDKVLTEDIINENNYNNVLYLIRSHRVILKNSNIKKIIIKYNVIDKESKYEVRNNVAYVPIFFDNHIMVFEDDFGNRFYEAEMIIKPIFNRRDLELYILENFSPKEIMDVTKLIKLNEMDEIKDDETIIEINEVLSNITATSYIKEKFKSKTIDYYYKKILTGQGLTEKQIYEVKNLTFRTLDFDDKRKIVKILLALNEIELVYEKILMYGFNLLQMEDLKILLEYKVDNFSNESSSSLLNEFFLFISKGGISPKILSFLSKNYKGKIENIVYILNECKNQGLDYFYISKYLLMLCLECGVSEYLDYAYENYNSLKDEDERLDIAYLNKKATDYFLDNMELDTTFFDRLVHFLANDYDNMENMPLIFLLAVTKYISTIKVLNSNDYRRVLIKAMNVLLDKEMIFAYFKEINNHMQMPYSIMNKEYIEYHATKDFVPKAILTISGDEEKKVVELNKVFMNIYLKKITVFKNEVVKYEIIDSNNESRGVLETGELMYDEKYELEYPKRNKVKSTFDYINDTIVSLDRDNIENMKRIVIDLVKKQEISKHLFNI